MYIARTSKNAPFCFKFFKICWGSMPPNPPRRVWAQPNWLQKLSTLRQIRTPPHLKSWLWPWFRSNSCILRTYSGAKNNNKEPKEHHNSTKGGLGYKACMPRVRGRCEPSLEAQSFFHIHVLILVSHKVCSKPFSPSSLGISSSNLLTAIPNCEYLTA